MMDKDLIRELTKNILAIMIVSTLCVIAIKDGKLYETLTAVVGTAAVFYFNTRGKNKDDAGTNQPQADSQQDTPPSGQASAFVTPTTDNTVNNTTPAG